MLTNKGYYIPKYLYRRKIEQVRQKIIKRKFAHLFYRKTLSQILPSQARKHYERSLKKKYLKRWVLHWYTEMIEWKLILRAEIHYNLCLQLRFLKRWKYFHLQRKANRIKEQIAVALHQKNCTRKIKLLYIFKWKIYMKHRREKKCKLRFAWNFFKSKYKPEILSPYFKKWKIFCTASKKNKIKLASAIKFYETSLAIKTLQKIKIYTKNNRQVKKIVAEAVDFYQSKLLQRTIKTWLLYVKLKQRTEQNIILAETHYCYKLKFNYLQRMSMNKKRNQLLKHKLKVASKWHEKKTKIFYFNVLCRYLWIRQCKKETYSFVRGFYDIRLKEKVTIRLREYSQYRIEKRKTNRQRLQAATVHLNRYLLKKCFEKLKHFKRYKAERKIKVLTANRFYTKCVQIKAFKTWTSLVRYKKARRKTKLAAITFYNLHLKNTSIVTWKNYMREENEFKRKLLEAKIYYEQNVINQGLLVIMKAGLNEKCERLEKSRDKIHHQLFLAQKYFSRWKQNVFYKNAGHESKNKSTDDENTEENKENIPQVSNFDWYQICFLTPRLPNGYLEALSNS